jgi:HK97 family phage major capsid protein
MKETETKARAGEGAPFAPAGEAKSAVTEFLSEFYGFQNDLHARLQQQDERMSKLERKTIPTGRPVLSGQTDAGAPHRKAFAAYLRTGDDDALRGLTVEEKAMSTAVNADGGFLVAPEMSERIQSVLSSTSSLRSISNVVNVEATTYDAIVDRTEVGSGWATETAAAAETSTPVIERRSIRLHELSAMPKASQRLLDDAAFDVEGWLAERIANRFSRAEAGAFVNGDGVDKPFGFLTYPKVTDGTWAWGSLGYVPTGAAGDFHATKPSDALVDLVYTLNAEYRANATWVMNSKTTGAVRKMKDADGRFLWTDSLAGGDPARLLGYPVLISEDMPDIGASTYSIAFGDFRAGYTIAERPDLRVLRDPFSAKPHVLFYASKRVGGDVTDFSAIKLLKFAVS